MASALDKISAKVEELQSEVDAANARTAAAYERMTHLQEQAAAAQLEVSDCEAKMRSWEDKYKEEREARLKAEKELATVKQELDDLGLS
mmetsp:Transcript_115545/g.162427  ORF Transcript_115545/g.162427 Transcript_115545/m.162427 type:complete len:89 (+) Transcript_115545:253-519(+)